MSWEPEVGGCAVWLGGAWQTVYQRIYDVDLKLPLVVTLRKRLGPELWLVECRLSNGNVLGASVAEEHLGQATQEQEAAWRLGAR